MKKTILKCSKVIEVVEAPVPQPGPGEVLLRILMTGICGTDVSAYKGHFAVKPDIVLGHEYCALVEEPGPDTKLGYRRGDYVASGASWGCGACRWCQLNLPSYCEKPVSLARTTDGSLQEYLVVPETLLYRLEEGTSLEDGQGVVGVSTALRAAKRGRVAPADDVLIVGPGYGGLLISQICTLMGARVTLAGTRKGRLEKALDLGVDEVVDIKAEPDWQKRLLAKNQYGFDVCIEAAGTLSALASCIELCRKGGNVVEFGTAHGDISGISQDVLYRREISIIGSKGGFGCYHQAVELISRHKVTLAPLITHTLPLAETARAFEIADRRLDDVIRAAVLCSQG
jgi:L-iditol 2-dehydrogenase